MDAQFELSNANAIKISFSMAAGEKNGLIIIVLNAKG